MVWQLNPELAVVQTVDFITPVLDDPYAFGAVAAANAISDVYAMGATPVMALNLVAFPAKTLPLSILGEILRGAADKAAEAGVIIAGGHSVDDSGPKYGMAVTGTVDPRKIVTKKGARNGDVLFLTKPLGTGIITTALDRQMVGEDLAQRVYEVMAQLNQGAARAMQEVGVHACTDVTGFGLLGHLNEMLRASGVAATLRLGDIPIIPEAWDLARAGAVPAGTYANLRYLANKVAWGREILPAARLILCDAQTSGGLLVAVAPDKADRLAERLAQAGCLAAARIGEVREGPAGTVEVLT